MKNPEDFTMENMKADIAKAGNLFYQYRACRRDASIIYDIENIRHGVVYARTPLQMNDPFDSKVGFSVGEIYEECIDFALDQVDTTLDSDLKLVIKSLLKYRMIGETLGFVNALNKLKKHILLQSVIAHVQPANMFQFITRDLNKLYSKCPPEVKKYFNKESFYVFALIKHYDLLIDEGNDPVHDSEPLREYMDKWDGQAFIDKMELDKDKTILEIGVGTGRLAVRVAPLCGEFYGVDISSKTIERAKENLAEFENVRLTCADFLSYEFGRAFDVVYSSLTFMHIEDKQRAVNKIAGLLNDAGRFVLSIDKNPSEFIDTGTRKIRIFPDTPVEMAKCIRTAGLTILNQYDTEFATIFVAQKG